MKDESILDATDRPKPQDTKAGGASAAFRQPAASTGDFSLDIAFG
jgi:hypothetical protein